MSEFPTLTSIQQTTPPELLEMVLPLQFANSLYHTLNQNYQTPHIQATSITISVSCGPITIAAVYCPQRHTISNEQYQHFFKSLGKCFIAGDYNAKHTLCDSRLISPKGRTLFKVIQKMKLSHISTGSPSYWPADLTFN